MFKSSDLSETIPWVRKRRKSINLGLFISSFIYGFCFTYKVVLFNKKKPPKKKKEEEELEEATKRKTKKINFILFFGLKIKF